MRDVLLPIGAVGLALLLFGGFVGLAGASPPEAWAILFKGAFGDWFSWQNTLQRAAPLMLTALCVALPARAGLVVIGGEGALVLGGLAGAWLAQGLPASLGWGGTVALCAAGAAAGAAWIALAGALRQWRGVNETISSLLLAYVAIGLFKHLVEGPLRDPASLNKPSTPALPEGLLIPGIAGSDVHGGLVLGVAACVLAAFWLRWTPSGFALRVVGGNLRAAQLVGLPARRLVVVACALGGAAAGLAGAVEVAAVHTAANASLIAGYGYAGILVAFMARHQPLAIVPVAILFGGFGAAGSLLQRRLGLPDASVLVLQGLAFVKSGRINLGLEGVLVLSAMAAFGGAWLSGSAWTGVLCAVAAGGLLASLHGVLCSLPRVNDVATGIALMLLGMGLAFYLGKPLIQPQAPQLAPLALGAWSSTPALQAALQLNPLLPLGLVLAAVLAWVLRATRWGLRVRMAGDSANAARALGYSVPGLRMAATAAGGMIAGLGGACLTLFYPGSWNEGISSGQGLIAVALVIFARWSPLRCAAAALLFGAAGALGPALQSIGIGWGYHLFNIVPYLLTLVILVISCRPGQLAAGSPGELSSR